MSAAMEISIRLFRPEDSQAVERLTIDAFDGVTLEQLAAEVDALWRRWLPTKP